MRTAVNSDGDHDAGDTSASSGWAPRVPFTWKPIVLAVVVAVLLALAMWRIADEVQIPSLVRPLAPPAAAAELAFLLGRWGLALTVIGFVLLAVLQVVRAFDWTAGADTRAAGPWGELITGLPALIATPIGVGIALILIAALLLLGVSLTSEDASSLGLAITPRELS
jgi:hypothetical protein